MVHLTRSSENPILKPSQENDWEKAATFNGCVIEEKGLYHLVYRAVSSLNLSSIGYGVSEDGIHFTNRQQLIKPEYEWEKFGCEDPRITKLNDKFFIFYTALETFPFTPQGIKLGVATTKDFQKIEEKHPVTPFNSKAMALFPETIKGKLAAILTVHTDIPPAKIGIAFFDEESHIWSKEYWENWYSRGDANIIPLQRSLNDHLEAGAPPLKTEFGWLVIYSYIKNYFSQARAFGIEAVLLDLHNPLRVIGRTKKPLLVPEEDYELYGNVPNVIFPSGAILRDGELAVYYGAADTTCCLATCKLDNLMAELLPEVHIRDKEDKIKLQRFQENPLIAPNKEHPWESKATFNPAAIYENEKVHIVYRAIGEDDTSVLGYASAQDGIHIEERLAEPIYTPRESFEKKIRPGNSGCEDPRITKIQDRLYMCYTAYDAKNPTRIALTSIKVTDFINKHWNWEKPKLISLPGINDKNACILPEKINGKYVIFHRLKHCIWIDFVDDLEFGRNWLAGDLIFPPRLDSWDSEKVGIGGPPIKTEDGWLLVYHGLSLQDKKYRLGAALLELNNPAHVISRLKDPILEPEAEYENKGLRPGTVFSCGAVVLDGQLFVYYGGADQVVCGASENLNKILEQLKK